MKRQEAERDQNEGAFTVLLRELLVHRRVLAVALVDSEGECVDYCSVVEPYEAKVAGALLGLALRQVGHFAAATDIGRVGTMEILADERDLVVRNMGEGYSLAMVAEAGAIDQDVMATLRRVSRRVGEEAGLPPPGWDSDEPGLWVATREAVGWAFAPVAFKEGDGDPVAVIDVIGRWEERGGLVGSPLTCFRVRLEDGSEATLAFDEGESLWMRW
ncbi:MAG: hypothetical protein CMN30_23205 [Sandaracinus sp.]|nr:hypothetical protein [Sandaracinus sp.]